MRRLQENNISDVVLDSLPELFPGLEIGSGQAHLTPITRRLRQIATEGRHKIVWAVHWTRKQFDSIKRLILDDLFGGPAMRYAPDVVIAINKRGPLRVFESVKARDGLVGATWWAKVDAVTGALISTGDPSERESRLLALVHERPRRAEELAEEIGVKPNTITKRWAPKLKLVQREKGLWGPPDDESCPTSVRPSDEEELFE